MKLKFSKKIVFDYFDGKLNPDERALVEDWIRDQDNEELFYLFLHEWEKQNQKYSFDIEGQLKEVKSKLDFSLHIDDEAEVGEKRRIYKFRYFFYAAASILLCALVYFSGNSSSEDKGVYESMVESSKVQHGEIYEKVNISDEAMVVYLPDGSSVVLQKNSKISYSPKNYNTALREVYLSGDAFFEVQKNKNVPFVVYANGLITKVLGTSFRIKAIPNSKECKVTVKTGNVAIYKQSDKVFTEILRNNELSGLVLLPNQEIVLNTTEDVLKKLDNIGAEELEIPIQRQSFEFDDMPAIQVFNILKMAYNVQIEYDFNKLKNCKITASLGDEPLMEKIKLLCFALNAEYQEVDDRIIIQLEGCE